MERGPREAKPRRAADDPDASRRTRATYDVVAPDFLRRTRDRSHSAATFEDFLARLPARARVLDLGAGPGVDTAALCARGLRAVALDLSLPMLRAGGDEFPAPRVQADMRRLPFRRAFHAVWAQASLLHLARPELPRVLEALRALLVPPALLQLTLKHGAGDGFETARYGESLPRWFTYWEPESLDDALAAAGFRVLAAATRQGSQDVWLVRLATAAPLESSERSSDAP